MMGMMLVHHWVHTNNISYQDWEISSYIYENKDLKKPQP